MTSAYQQQLAQQLRAAEDELGKHRRERASLIERTQLAEAGARERAALLEHARDLLEPWGGHGDAWPDIAPAIETLIARAEQAEARIAELTANLAPTEDALTRVIRALDDVRATRGLLGAVIADQIQAAIDRSTP